MRNSLIMKTVLHGARGLALLVPVAGNAAPAPVLDLTGLWVTPEVNDPIKLKILKQKNIQAYGLAELPQLRGAKTLVATGSTQSAFTELNLYVLDSERSSLAGTLEPWGRLSMIATTCSASASLFIKAERLSGTEWPLHNDEGETDRQGESSGDSRNGQEDGTEQSSSGQEEGSGQSSNGQEEGSGQSSNGQEEGSGESTNGQGEGSSNADKGHQTDGDDMIHVHSFTLNRLSGAKCQ